MKEFIEKLISRLEEREVQAYAKMDGGITYQTYRNAIEIVNQLAEEYNNESVKGDLISRSELIEWLKKVTVTDGITFETGFKQILTDIENQPTVYNNGWIPCSERLPKDDSICIVTVEYPNNETVVDYGWFDRVGVCWYVGIQEFRTSNILAWQPLPAPYQPKGE